MFDKTDFKTSHVIVYPHKQIHIFLSVPFQNISCYCLSHISITLIAFSSVFQNISCYCLSVGLGGTSEYIRLFQNISCYCLSSFRRNVLFWLKNFKTSHVIVYRICTSCIDACPHISKHLMLLFISDVSLSINISSKYFKTSHVIVYPTPSIRICESSCYFKTSHVIVYPKGTVHGNNIIIFQNISCYCLSAVRR